ncbi:polysaccharide deacetylase [bacterium]|nr:MAG: polysaccharide deacetylase [bacterium]
MNNLYNKKIPVFLIATALFLLCAANSQAKITNYRSVYKPFYDGTGALKITLREFKKKGQTNMALVLDPYTFATYTALLADTNETSSKATETALQTPFKRALNRYTALPAVVENHGITSSEMPVKGVFLTADMCPSSRQIDKDLDERTAELGNGNEAMPIAIAISGNWIKAHKREFSWLLNQERAKKLSITWVNHSLTHPYKENAPNEKNFLLTKGVVFEREVLKNEILMLESGITPSPFFRFPGLIASDALMEKLNALSLIPVGTNAWLGKGEDPKAGSIILVHGNGNERAGVNTLLRYYNRNKARFENGTINLLPLKDAFGH